VGAGHRRIVVIEDLQAARISRSAQHTRASQPKGHKAAPLNCLATRRGDAQSPAAVPCHPRGFPGPSLLAMILFEKFGRYQPLNRQWARPLVRREEELDRACAASQRLEVDANLEESFSGLRLSGLKS
jgi:transposase